MILMFVANVTKRMGLADQTIIIYSDHYIEPHYFDGSCVFEKIEKIASDTYLIHSNCTVPDQHLIEEAQIIDDQLVLRNIPEG